MTTYSGRAEFHRFDDHAFFTPQGAPERRSARTMNIERLRSRDGARDYRARDSAAGGAVELHRLENYDSPRRDGAPGLGAHQTKYAEGIQGKHVLGVAESTSTWRADGDRTRAKQSSAPTTTNVKRHSGSQAMRRSIRTGAVRR